MKAKFIEILFLVCIVGTIGTVATPLGWRLSGQLLPALVGARHATTSARRTQQETTVTNTSLRSGKVEAIKIHHLIPRSHEVTHERLL